MNAAAAVFGRPLGEHWQFYVGSSAFGVLWRAMRINCLHRGDLRTLLGVTVRSTDEVFTKCLSLTVQDRLRQAYPQLATDMWDAASWWPFGGAMPKDVLPWRARFCPTCARHCYHSMLFEMPGVDQCPWHGVPLTRQCPRCDRDVLAGFSAGLPIGRCACGHDLVDFVATVEGDATSWAKKTMAVDKYRAQTQRTRKETWLVPTEQEDLHAWSVLDGLIVNRIRAPAATSGRWNGDRMVMFDQVKLDRCLQYPANSLSPKSGLETFRPGIVALPVGWYSPFRAIARELSNALVQPLGERIQTDEELRSVLQRMPVHVCGRRLFLQTECLHRAVLRTASRLCSVLATPQAKRFLRNEDYVDRVDQHPLGKRLVERTIQRLLTRGYADGTRVALGRQVPQLYDTPTTRPVTRYPWVLLNLRNNRLPSATIGWTRQPTLSCPA